MVKSPKYLAEGNTDTTLWTSRSVGKSVVSTLVGIAIQQGKIHSLDDLITVYEPELKAPPGRRNAEAVDSTHQRVEWNEDYTDPQSHFARLTQCEAHPAPMPACVRSSPAARQHRRASSGPTLPAAHGSGDITERATGMSLAAGEQALAAGRDGPTACGMLISKEARRRRPRL